MERNFSATVMSYMYFVQYCQICFSEEPSLYVIFCCRRSNSFTDDAENVQTSLIESSGTEENDRHL